MELAYGIEPPARFIDLVLNASVQGSATTAIPALAKLTLDFPAALPTSPRFGYRPKGSERSV